MKYISTLIISLFLFSCNQTTTKKPHNNNQELKDDYTAIIDSIITATSPRIFNGVVQITKGGETKYLKEHGYSNFDEKTPISIKDHFRIMSNSKQITAALILKEVKKGKINLQSPIGEYVKDLNQAWANEVTVHQLLNMSSGIIDIEKALIFEPGKGYRYSNPGYGLLGKIVENVTGKEYSESANELFLELGMKETYCYELDKANIGLINGYDLKENRTDLIIFDSLGHNIETWKKFIPAGGIISTANDLLIWDSALHHGKIVENKLYKQMIQPSNEGPHAAFDNDTIGYAYGLRIHDKHPVKHLGHGGRGFGFVSIKFYVPEKEVNVIVWENIYCRDANVMAGDIVYHYENEIRKIVLNSNLVR